MRFDSSQINLVDLVFGYLLKQIEKNELTPVKLTHWNLGSLIHQNCWKNGIWYWFVKSFRKLSILFIINDWNVLGIETFWDTLYLLKEKNSRKSQVLKKDIIFYSSSLELPGSLKKCLNIIHFEQVQFHFDVFFFKHFYRTLSHSDRDIFLIAIGICIQKPEG